MLASKIKGMNEIPKSRLVIFLRLVEDGFRSISQGSLQKGVPCDDPHVAAGHAATSKS